jgi:flagellar hook-length control protein FliK
MISFDVKSEAKASSSPLGLSSKEEKSTLSFSDLLKGASLKKDEKPVQNGSLVLSFGDEPKDAKTNVKSSKNDILLSLLKKGDAKEAATSVKTDAKVGKNDALNSLLKGDVKEAPISDKADAKSSKSDILRSLLSGDAKEVATQDAKNELPIALNPKLTASMSVADLRVLVKDAKNYLKEKILSSDDYKRSEIKELPQTLKGLAQMAKKFGVDVTKITIEEVRVSVKPQAKELKIESSLKADSNAQAEPNVKAEQAAKALPQEVKIQDKAVVLKEAADIVRVVKEVKATKTEKSSVNAVKTQAEVKPLENVATEEKKAEVSKEIKSTPLFKAQAQTEHTTEQLVQAKQFTVETKTPKQRADETLKLLLSGEKAAKGDVALTADFSVTSAKVIAPQATSEAARGLEALLMGENADSSETTSVSKTDGLNVHKADSLEVKLNEAKQMVKYLSQDVKTAIEDYKSPFTRVKVQLNPQRLGEIDLTIVQRGNNLHINLTSNNAAINALAMNVNDLKTQLSNNGINNATFNFNDNSQGENSQPGQQRRQGQQGKNAENEYNYFDTNETNEEILSSLEIVVTRYA